MKKLWSHGWFAALFTGVAFLLIPTVSAGAETSTTIQGKAAAAVPANEASPTPSGELIEFDVGLNLKDLPGAEALAKEVTDPTSRNYRRYLTPSGGRAASRRASGPTGKSWHRCAAPASRSPRWLPTG